LEHVFRSFPSSNLENTFRSFFSWQKKFEKRIPKYLFKRKKERSGSIKKHGVKREIFSFFFCKCVLVGSMFKIYGNKLYCMFIFWKKKQNKSCKYEFFVLTQNFVMSLVHASPKLNYCLEQPQLLQLIQSQQPMEVFLGINTTIIF
jgi:hypothetical protein